MAPALNPLSSCRMRPSQLRRAITRLPERRLGPLIRTGRIRWRWIDSRNVLPIWKGKFRRSKRNRLRARRLAKSPRPGKPSAGAGAPRPTPSPPRRRPDAQLQQRLRRRLSTRPASGGGLNSRSDHSQSKRFMLSHLGTEWFSFLVRFGRSSGSAALALSTHAIAI